MSVASIVPCDKPPVPPAVCLWPHQRQAGAAVRAAVNSGRGSGLVVMPTGSGKTVLFACVARYVLNPALVLVHRDELIRQTVRTTGRVWPEAKVGVIQAERDEWQDGQDLVVASVPSLHARRLGRMPRDRFGIVVVDEAHHAAAASYTAVLEHFQARFRLGVTATPQRLDGQGLAEWFGPEPLFVYSIKQAIDDKRLVPVKQFQVKTGISLDGVGSRGGDFVEGELSRAVNNPVRNQAVVDAYAEHASDRRGICFAVDLEHVAALTKAFQDAGISAASVTGEDHRDDRRLTLLNFASGVYRVLVNCQIATEGFDDQGVNCVVMARPTQSGALYVQSIGRGLRRCDETGKEDCLILDITDNCRKHKLVTAIDLLPVERGPGETPPERENSSGIRKPRHTNAPVSWCLAEVPPWPGPPTLNGYRPRHAWQQAPATDKQLSFLRAIGLVHLRPLTKGEASWLLDQAKAYEAAFPTPATRRQEWFLRLAGHWTEGLGKREASRRIARLKGE